MMRHLEAASNEPMTFHSVHATPARRVSGRQLAQFFPCMHCGDVASILGLVNQHPEFAIHGRWRSDSGHTPHTHRITPIFFFLLVLKKRERQ